MSTFDSSEIKKNRTASAEVAILQADGSPLAHQEVVIAQTSHKFLFGTTGFDILMAGDELSGEEQERTAQFVDKATALFNSITLPFYWARFEPQRGHPMTDKLMKAARWCVERQISVKGHPLCWHTLAADWLLSMSNKDILRAQIERIQREVTNFRGVIDCWDVINEAVIMPIFNKYDNGLTRLCKELGRINTVKAMFEATRNANPAATLLINDFDMSPAYDILVEGCLEAGIKIDVIGIQSHMHQGYWGVEKTLRVLEQFSRFNLPIHFTETNIVSGHLMPPEIVDLNDYQMTEWPTTPEGEERQAQEVILHYRTLFAHPLVESVTWWDFGDGRWLNSPAGLLRKDASNKPAYEELFKLVKGEWWTPPTQLSTDDHGMVRFTGFLGGYELQCRGGKRTFALNTAGASTIEIRL